MLALVATCAHDILTVTRPACIIRQRGVNLGCQHYPSLIFTFFVISFISKINTQIGCMSMDVQYFFLNEARNMNENQTSLLDQFILNILARFGANFSFSFLFFFKIKYSNYTNLVWIYSKKIKKYNIMKLTLNLPHVGTQNFWMLCNIGNDLICRQIHLLIYMPDSNYCITYQEGYWFHGGGDALSSHAYTSRCKSISWRSHPQWLTRKILLYKQSRLMHYEVLP